MITQRGGQPVLAGGGRLIPMSDRNPGFLIPCLAGRILVRVIRGIDLHVKRGETTAPKARSSPKVASADLLTSRLRESEQQQQRSLN